jgi:hypothetical protein
MRGDFELPGTQRLVLHSREYYDPIAGVIKGTQYFSISDRQGNLELERRLAITFSLIDNKQFESMTDRAGFIVQKLYGDYNRSEFDLENSPFMIYFLSKK